MWRSVAEANIRHLAQAGQSRLRGISVRAAERCVSWVAETGVQVARVAEAVGSRHPVQAGRGRPRCVEFPGARRHVSRVTETRPGHVGLPARSTKNPYQGKI